MTPQLHVLLFIIFTTTVLLIYTISATNDAAYPSMYGEETCRMSGEVELIPPRRETYDNGRIIDITHQYHPDMPMFDSHDGIGQIMLLRSSIKNGSLANMSEMKLSVHHGTHLDAPGHFYDHYFDAGFDVGTLDLGVLNGPGLLVDVPWDKNITADVMKALHIPKGVRRVLFRTLNTERRLMFNKKFDSSFTGFVRDGAQWLVDNTDIKLVGVDYISVAAYDELKPVHLALLESRDIIPVEGLKLDNVPVGMYNIHCLPLRLRGSEGSPVRCILMK